MTVPMRRSICPSKVLEQVGRWYQSRRNSCSRKPRQVSSPLRSGKEALDQSARSCAQIERGRPKRKVSGRRQRLAEADKCSQAAGAGQSTHPALQLVVNFQEDRQAARYACLKENKPIAEK
jgi:hypothetical protein